MDTNNDIRETSHMKSEAGDTALNPTQHETERTVGTQESQVKSNKDKKLSQDQERAYNNACGAYKSGITSDKVVEYYNNWKSYDSDLSSDNYIGPLTIAKYVNKSFCGKHNIRILDVGAGSGRVAEEIVKFGFKNIHALEPAREFFEKSKNKELYQSYICGLLGPGTVNIQDDSFDVIVACGSFGEGHIPCTGLNDIIRLVKPGGFIFIMIREAYLDNVAEYKGRLEPYMKQLEEQGKWKMVERTKFDGFFLDMSGIIFVFQVAKI